MEPNVARTFVAIYVLALLATIGAILFHSRSRTDASRELLARTLTWWGIIVFITFALSAPRYAGVISFAFLSFLALKEYLSLIPTRQDDRIVIAWMYLAVLLQYFFIGIEWYGIFIIFIPVYMFLLIPLQMVGLGKTDGFLRAVGSLHWGLMITVFSISHMAYLLVLPGDAPTVAGGAGLVLYLLLTTELNDMAAFVWGKLLGRKKIIPKISPGKTWGGLLGGFATTLAAAVLLAPYLTPLDLQASILAGCMIGICGFFGDAAISALKRDLGIKDSGTMLPGHGGILDRVDSLTFTAPIFLHFIRFNYF